MTAVHPRHAPEPLHRVLRQGSYPWAVAGGPLKRYLKSWRGGRAYDGSLAAVLRQTIATARHCYPRQSDVIWATVQRAGHNWVSLVYTLVVERVYHQREIDIENIAQYRAGVYRHIPIRYDLGDHQTRFHYHLPIPRLMHTHDPFYPWMAARRVLLQVRHPRDVLISKYVHGDFYPHTSFQAYLQTPTVAGLMRFYESWGQALAQGRLRAVHCLKYEDMRHDPLAQMRGVLAFFGLDAVPDASIEAALAQTTPEQMRHLEQSGKNLGDEQLLYNVKSTRPAEKADLQPADYAALDAFISANMPYDFGYREGGS